MINLYLIASFLFCYAVPPSVKAVNQLVGAPVESHVSFACIVEAFPKPLNRWFSRGGEQQFPSLNSHLSSTTSISCSWISHGSFGFFNFPKWLDAFFSFSFYVCASSNSIFTIHCYSCYYSDISHTTFMPFVTMLLDVFTCWMRQQTHNYIMVKSIT